LESHEVDARELDELRRRIDAHESSGKKERRR
jgi:hypothetical protein